MTPAEIAGILQARPVGTGRWTARCPAHEDRSPSVSLREAADGRTLIYCHAGCETADVLAAVGLTWQDLFPDDGPRPWSRSPDPRTALRQRAERGLREWRERFGRLCRDRLHRRHRLITAAEKLLNTERHERGLELLALGYIGFDRLEWLCDLLDSRKPGEWLRARRFLRGAL